MTSTSRTIDNKDDKADLAASNEFVCISCLSPSGSLYQKYSADVIRLTECKNCGSVVDKYVEFDTMLVVIDLILHYSAAYRHIIYNRKIRTYLRLAVIFLFCDAYDKWISGRAAVAGSKDSIYDLEWIFYESLCQSAVEMLTYVLVIVVMEWWRGREDVASTSRRIQLVAQSTIVGYYGNVAVVLSIIFRLSNELPYRAATQLFQIISHIQIQRALSPQLGCFSCVAVVAVAMLSSKAVGTGFRYLLNS